MYFIPFGSHTIRRSMQQSRGRTTRKRAVPWPVASGQPKSGQGHADSSSPLVMPPFDQCPGNGHGGQQLKGPAALPCRLSRLRNIGQRQCRRHGISLLPCPARPPRIASAPGSLQANGSHSCCVQTPDSTTPCRPPKERIAIRQTWTRTGCTVTVYRVSSQSGCLAAPRLRLPDATLALHPHLPAAVFVPFSAVVVAPTPSPARPRRKRSGRQRYKCQLWGRGRGCLYLDGSTGTPETNRTRRVKSHLPNREPRAARSQAPSHGNPAHPAV